MPHFIIIMIVMAWLSQAQDQEIYPAKIFANINKHKLEFTCSTHGLKEKEKHSTVYIYFCRNGIGIDRKSSCGDVTFSIDDPTKDNTGNYSCLFSVHNYNYTVVKGNGMNPIVITVNDSFMPAEIASPQTSVKTGSDVEFQCKSLDMPSETNQTGNIYAYLCKNSTVIQMTIWDSVKNKARFILKEVTMQDAGTYICFLMSDQRPFPKKVHSINEVNLHITDSFIPAEIALPWTSVKTGNDVEFQCSSEYMSPETNQTGNIYAYLSKNSTVIQMTIWDSVKNKARFTLKEVTMQDAGTYICFLMSEQHSFPKKVHGINEVNLHVTDGTIHLIAIAPLAALLLVGLVFIIIYRNRKMINDKLCQNPGQSNEPANTRNDEGLEQVNPTVTSHGSYRNEIYNDMQEYATIPEVGGLQRLQGTITVCAITLEHTHVVKMRPEHIYRSSSIMTHFILMLMIVMAWLSQAQDQEIYPAKIFSNINKHKLEFTCSTHGLKEKEKHSTVYIYLCRNGIGIDRKSTCGDVTFSIDDPTKDNTGNYSCLFSVHNYNYTVVKGNGMNPIVITVNDSFMPAEIASPQTSVKTGSDVEFQCKSLDMPSETDQKRNIYAYLSKNSTVIQMTIWDSVKNQARFTLKEVTMQDAGTYICFLMSDQRPFPKKVHSINEVNLHVTDGKTEFTEYVKIAVVSLAALLLVGVVFIIMFCYKKMINDSRNHSRMKFTRTCKITPQSQKYKCQPVFALHSVPEGMVMYNLEEA
ncbi:immunoglobulin superfamily member 1-like [Clarias magur]|nr:immunoglobulin superfamily member 1-like [Clarias magur]